jgi:hypothetical protein
MPDNWETYRDWKELMENIRKKPQVEDTYDDDVDDLNELFKEYID